MINSSPRDECGQIASWDRQVDVVIALLCRLVSRLIVIVNGVQKVTVSRVPLNCQLVMSCQALGWIYQSTISMEIGLFPSIYVSSPSSSTPARPPIPTPGKKIPPEVLSVHCTNATLNQFLSSIVMKILIKI